MLAKLNVWQGHQRYGPITIDELCLVIVYRTDITYCIVGALRERTFQREGALQQVVVANIGLFNFST